MVPEEKAEDSSGINYEKADRPLRAHLVRCSHDLHGGSKCRAPRAWAHPGIITRGLAWRAPDTLCGTGGHTSGLPYLPEVKSLVSALLARWAHLEMAECCLKGPSDLLAGEQLIEREVKGNPGPQR